MRDRLTLLFVAVGVACAEEPLKGPPALATHVDDWRDEVIYAVMVDRFDNGDPTNDLVDGVGVDLTDLRRHQGGDWRGLRRRLDYIRELGATAIWISPIVANVARTETEDGYHGYWASDFTTLNPRFGDLDELRRLVTAAHDRGMLVIVDVVTNHTGRVFDYDLNFDGVLDEGEAEPPYLDAGYEVPLLWSHRPRLFLAGGVLELGAEHFRRRGRGDFEAPGGKVYGDFPTGLRDLDTEREDVLQAFVETYVRWVEQTDVDGFRIDAVPHVEDAFWPRFAAAVRERLARQGKHRFLLLGEVFSGDPVQLARYSAPTGALDAAFDFALKFDVIDGVILEGRAPVTAVGALETYRERYRPFPQPGGVGIDPWQARVGLVDNHDTWRLRGELDRFDAAALALLVLATVDAIPCIYYGTEQELRGRGGSESRERMADTGFRTDGATFLWLQRLLALRRDEVVLRRGELRVRYASEEDGYSDAEDAGMLAYERTLDDDRILVVINAHALKASRARVPSGFPAGAALRDLLGAGDWNVEPGGIVDVALPPRGAVLLGVR